MLLQKVLEGFSLMGGRIIQQHDHRAAQVPQQLTEKNANLLLPDVIEVKLIVQAQVLSSRTYRNPGNDGDLVAPPLAAIVNRRTASWGPAPGHKRNQQEARFINKN